MVIGHQVMGIFHAMPGSTNLWFKSICNIVVQGHVGRSSE
jgi:hypothetical protein